MAEENLSQTNTEPEVTQAPDEPISTDESFTEILTEDFQEAVEEDVDAPDVPDTPEDDKPVDGVVEETPPEEVVEEVVEEPAKPVETPVEEPTPEPKDDTEAIAEAREQILKALGITKEKEQEMEEAGYQTPWGKRGEKAPKTYDELLEAAVGAMEYKKAEQDKISEEKRIEQDKVSEEATKTRMVELQEQQDTANANWDTQLEYMRESDMIPSIAPEVVQKLKEGKSLTAAEVKDPGLVAQGQIFQEMYNVAEAREKEGKSPISDAVHIYTRYVKPKLNKKPAGATAPVSGGKGALPTSPTKEVSYEEDHNASFEDILSNQ